jgi:hypothetical protein
MIAKTKASHQENGLGDGKVNARDDLISLMITEPNQTVVLCNLHPLTCMDFFFAVLIGLMRDSC